MGLGDAETLMSETLIADYMGGVCRVSIVQFIMVDVRTRMGLYGCVAVWTLTGPLTERLMSGWLTG